MLDLLIPQGPSIRERIAQTNLATTHRVGVETMQHSLDAILRDREATHRVLEDGAL
jgi:hypothetical protein